MRPKRKVCFFTKNHVKYIDYKDVETLQRFVTPDGKILARSSTGTSAKYQRQLAKAIKNSISRKDKDLKGQMASEGTTPRQLTDLLGSLCDLTSGSGDKGTPIILIQGYFDNYTND